MPALALKGSSRSACRDLYPIDLKQGKKTSLNLEIRVVDPAWIRIKGRRKEHTVSQMKTSQQESCPFPSHCCTIVLEKKPNFKIAPESANTAAQGLLLKATVIIVT
jgi:hypothetical protein